MSIQLDNYSDVRALLVGASSEELIRFMKSLSMSEDLSAFSEDVVNIAHEMKWIKNERCELSTQGICVADACREYCFWIERERVLPFANELRSFDIQEIKGRKVLEIGSGMGANLMSFQNAGIDAIGVEPIEAYSELGRIFSDREGIRAPQTFIGSAEELPFQEAEFDLILCISSHQYFDIRAAISEIARVIQREGELRIIGGTLGRYFQQQVGNIFSTRRNFKEFVVTLTDTLSYSIIGRRIVPRTSNHSTSRPIYPSERSIIRFLREAGFHHISQPESVGAECSFAAYQS